MMYSDRPTVAYFVHGRGRGHAARTRAVIPELAKRGITPRVLGGGQSRSLLSGLPSFEEIELFAPGPELARRFARRLGADLALLRADRPALVVSDGDGPSVHAALRLGVPSLAIGHGILYGHCALPKSIPLAYRVREGINGASSSWPSARRVVVHFHPAEPLTRGTVVARPDLPAGLDVDAQDEGFVLAYFRDDNGAALIARLVARGQRVVLFGGPGAAPPGVERREPSPEDFAAHLARCHAVVGSAGNHLPAECALLGKPMLAVYKRGDVEHQMNATLIEDAGIGLAAPLEGVSDETLDAFARLKPAPASERAIFRMKPASVAIADEVEALLKTRRAR